MAAKEMKCPHCGSSELHYDYEESIDFTRSDNTLEIETTFHCGECEEYSRHYEKYQVGKLIESSLSKA